MLIRPADALALVLNQVIHNAFVSQTSDSFQIQVEQHVNVIQIMDLRIQPKE